MFTWLIFLLLLWPLVRVLRVLLVTRALMGLEFRRTKVNTVSLIGIPPHLKEATKPWINQFKSLGFETLGGWILNGTTNEAFDDHAIVLAKTSQPVRAVLQVYTESARSGECWASLRTTRVNGSEIVTSSYAPEELLPPVPGVEVEILEEASPGELVQRHLTRINADGADYWHCEDVAAAATREQHVRDAILGFAHGHNVLKESETGIFSYRLGPALKRSFSIIQRAAQLKKNRRPNRRSVVSSLSAESQLEFDLQHYRQQGALLRGKFSLKAKTVIASLSFVIFAAVLAWQYSLVVAATLIIALVIHECGHLLGMRWFGYRDTQLLFVPFFGGAAIGHDEQVLVPWKHIVIILLGPIPGIFLALLLLVYASGGSAPDWINQVALTFLVLNAFNLLPILPLDGGQIVDYAMASRFPRVRVLFLAISALGLLLFGWLLGGTTILFGIGVATLLRLPVEWRLAGLRRRVREEFPEGGAEDPIVRRLVTEMRDAEWNKTSFSQRLQMVRGLQRVLRMQQPGLGSLCFAVVGFTAPLWLGAPLAIWAAARQGDARVEQAHARAEVAGITAVPVILKLGEVKPEDNAAIPFEQARTLAMGAPDEDGSNMSSPQKDRIITLLRTAAQKRVFVPSEAIHKKGSHIRFGAWTNGALVGHLTSAASERLRYRENGEAVALAIDALKLLRLMQVTPGLLNWNEYKFVADSGWDTIEEALASGAKLPPETLTELKHLCTETTDIAFAVNEIPRGFLMLGGANDDLESALNGAYTLRFLRMLQHVSPAWTSLQVESIDQAIVVHSYLQGIANGDWPLPVKASGNSKRSTIAVARLGDFLARQREAKLALLLLEKRQRGGKIPSLETLVSDKAELLHPYTRSLMTLAHRGSLDVLTFAGESSPTVEEDDVVENRELIWRVPSEQL